MLNLRYQAQWGNFAFEQANTCSSHSKAVRVLPLIDLTFVRFLDYNPDMTAMGLVREKVANLPERAFIRVADVPTDLIQGKNSGAKEQAFSRLAKAGQIARIAKGLYWKAPKSRFGVVPPPRLEAALAIAADRAPGPSGPTAAAYLGLTTQIPAVQELAVIGRESTKFGGTVFRERVNPKRDGLNPAEIAVLEIARDRLRYCETGRDQTVARLRDLAERGAINLGQIKKGAAGEHRIVQDFVALIA